MSLSFFLCFTRNYKKFKISRSLLFFVIFSMKRYNKKTNQVNFLRFFDSPLSKYLIFKKFFFSCIGCFGLLTKIKKGSETRSVNSAKFCNCLYLRTDLPNKNMSMLYSHYIDNIFMIWNGKYNDLKDFLQDLNKKHSKISFLNKKQFPF